MSLFKVLKSQSKHIQEFNDIEVNTKHNIIIIVIYHLKLVRI